MGWSVEEDLLDKAGPHLLRGRQGTGIRYSTGPGSTEGFPVGAVMLDVSGSSPTVTRLGLRGKTESLAREP